MKNQEQSGFILMIVVMIVVVVLVVGFAVYRVTQANSTSEPAQRTGQSSLYG